MACEFFGLSPSYYRHSALSHRKWAGTHAHMHKRVMVSSSGLSRQRKTSTAFGAGLKYGRVCVYWARLCFRLHSSCCLSFITSMHCSCAKARAHKISKEDTSVFLCCLCVCVRTDVCGLISFLIAFSSSHAGQLAFRSSPLVSYERSPHLRMIHPLQLV